MDLYTLGENFVRDKVIDEFQSVIWTERYSDAGEVTLVVPANKKNVAMLSEGTFIAEKQTKEIMEIQSQSVENGLLTVTGPSLVKFLNNRVIRSSADHKIQEWELLGLKPGQVPASIVEQICISGGFVDTNSTLVDGPKQKIAGLSIGAIESSGDPVNISVPFGPVFDVIQEFAKTHSLGINMQLNWASNSGYSVLFNTYRGRDLTRDQELNPRVQFSPQLDSLTGVKEVRSISGYKTVAYAFASNNPDDLATVPGVAYAYPGAADEVGFDRRVMMVIASDITSEMIGGTEDAPGNADILVSVLNQKAKDALANNNYIKMLDGEIVPQSAFKYGKDYFLGDILELQSMTGFWQKARVTEYIRTQDERGERGYPTVSVIG